MRRPGWETVLGIILILWTVAVFWQATAAGFVDYDDDITRNPQVKAGLTPASVGWAFTTIQSTNWNPLVWLSLEVDYAIYGLSAWGFHFTNVVLHAANALLVFLVLRRMTGAVWRSWLVAAFFALHPLRVESVAWLAERKDVLSTFFGLLTLLAYARYARQPGWGRYLLVVLTFAVGLMAKPMLVTLPFVLLLLDYWPLGRTPCTGTVAERWAAWRWLLLEKVPLLVLSAACSVVTWYAQQHGKAIAPLEVFPLAARLANALNAYVAYLGQTLWPVGLAPYYPHPGRSVSRATATAAGLLLAALTAFAVRMRRSHPYLLVGWLWYVGTLVPVIGLVQVGAQARADRYTYLPHIGLFVAGVWGLANLAARRQGRWAVAAAVGLGLILCSRVTWDQVRYWHDDEALWRRAVDVTTANARAHNNLGAVLGKFGRHREAIAEFQAALAVDPYYADAHYHLGVALAKTGRPAEALGELRRAVELDPGEPRAHEELGLLLAKRGGPDEQEEAERHFRTALQSDPDNAVVCFNLGLLLARQGREEEALPWLREAVRLQPNEARYHVALGYALRRTAPEAAEEQFREASRLGAGVADNGS
jgi:tetratricopeptide (TPR) repeat protein